MDARTSDFPRPDRALSWPEVDCDLSGEIEQENREHPSLLISPLASMGFGVAFLYLGLSAAYAEGLAATGEGPALNWVITAVGVGFILIGLNFGLSRNRAPNHVIVSAIGLTLYRPGRKKRTILEWQDANFRINILDRTTHRVVISGRSKIEYAIQYSLNRWSGGASLPLSRPAFEALMNEAHRRGMRFRPRMVWGIKLIEISR